MIIRDIMTSGVVECTEDTPLTEVYDLLQQCGHGYVVVLDSASHRVPIGIVDEHSICQQVVARGKGPRGLTAGNVINTRMRRISDNTNVESCSGLVETAGSEPILVTDEKRRFTGIVERSRLAAAICSAVGNSGTSSSAAPEFGNLIPSPTPRRVEIPAFGWLR